MSLFVILRHGPTDWTESGRLQGQADRPLSPAGRAAVAGWRLPPEPRSWHWYVSPLARARQTAAGLGLQAEPQAALTEMSWGGWEGERLGDLRNRLGAEMAAREALGLDFQPPGGESPRQVQDRLRPFLAQLAAAGRPVGAVAHRGVIRALFCLASGWDLRGKPPVKLADACLHRFRLDAEGRPSIEALNLPLAP